MKNYNTGIYYNSGNVMAVLKDYTIHLRRIRKPFLVFASLGALFAVSACESFFVIPTSNTAKRVELHHSEQAYRMPVTQFDEDTFDRIGRDYWRYGEGPVRVTVAYNRDLVSGSEAGVEAARLADGLRRNGIEEINTDILPTQSKEMQGLVTYDKVTAHKPRGCGSMPGAEAGISNANEAFDYDYGCQVESMIARQIMRPKDLAGRVRGQENVDGSSRGYSFIEPLRRGGSLGAIRETGTSN